MDFLPRLVLLWVLAVPHASNGQTDCPRLQIGDLGDTTAPSTTGLVAFTLSSVAGDTGTPSSVQVITMNTVCLGQGTVRDMYRSVSVIVDYLDGTTNMMMIAQVEFQCMGGMWGFQNEASFTETPTGTLMTSVRTDCTICLSPPLGTGLAVSPDEHCARKNVHVRMCM